MFVLLLPVCESLFEPQISRALSSLSEGAAKNKLHGKHLLSGKERCNTYVRMAYIELNNSRLPVFS